MSNSRADQAPHPATDPLLGEDAEARFQALVARVRREEAVFDRHGGLGRFDEDEDHNKGSLLYDAVVFQDTSKLDDGGWLDRLEGIARLEARLAGYKAEAVAAFDDALHGVSADLGHRHPEEGDRPATAGERRWHGGELRSVSDEIGSVLNMHRGAATRRIHLSWELVHNFQATLHALVEGVLTERAAFTIVAELSILDDLDDLRAAEAAVLDWASKYQLRDIKEAARREAARRDPAATDKAHRKAREERSVRMVSTDFGTADLIHSQNAADAAAVMTSLSRAAVRCRRNGDTRTLDQLRADIALTRLLRKRGTPSHAAGAPAGRDASSAGDAGTGADARTSAGAGTSADTGAGADARPTPDASTGSPGSGPEFVADADPDSDEGVLDDELALDEAVGADVTVVIHATGAELRALLEDRVSTGGEVAGLGPIPQNSLRHHLVKAISQTLIPALPTTPTGRRQRATFSSHSHPTAPTSHGVDSSHAALPSDAAGSSGPDASGSGSGSADAASRARDRGSRIELRITDEAPAGDPDRYTPSAATDRYVRWRDRTCQFPGCNRPAEYTDIDHQVAFAVGGRTTADNLHCLCRHHHRLKHEGNWQVHRNPDGTHTWTSPTGRRYREDAPDAHRDAPSGAPPHPASDELPTDPSPG